MVQWSNCFVSGGCLLSLNLWRRSFQDLLKISPASLFMLCGCISNSVASLMSRSMYPVFVERSFVSCSLIIWAWLLLCSATADFSACANRLCLLAPHPCSDTGPLPSTACSCTQTCLFPVLPPSDWLRLLLSLTSTCINSLAILFHLVFLFTWPVKVGHTECSETLAQSSDAGESPKRKNATFTTWWKFEIKNDFSWLIIVIDERFNTAGTKTCQWTPWGPEPISSTCLCTHQFS